MNKFRIEIFIKSKNDLYTTPESFITLFVYEYINCPKNIELEYVYRDYYAPESKCCDGNYVLRLNANHMNIDKDEIVLSSKKFSFSQSKEQELLINENSDNISKLPMFEHENLFIFGICAVSRAIVSQSGTHDNLLGFKKGCLLAPSENSIWTKLCEIDMIEAIRKILGHISLCRNSNKNIEKDLAEILLSNSFTIFENHMGQPTRAHNFYKILRQNQKMKNNVDNNGTKTTNTNTLSTLEHNFAEGYFFSLVDVILYPCISLLFLAISNADKFYTLFPLTYKWMKRIEKLDDDDDRNNLREIFTKILDVEFYRCNINAFKLNFVKNDKITTNSLYRNDRKPIAQDKVFTNQENIDACLSKISNLKLEIKSTNTLPEDIIFDWENIPYLARPEYGGLPEERLSRKKHQLRNLADAVCSIAKPNDVIVDFCSGTGHLGIALAATLPQCHIIFLENKSRSILKAKERVEQLKLSNCSFYQSNIDYFERSFDIGVSLHACGSATDIVLLKCINAKAKFICCPCCYGSILPMPHIRYPSSKKFKENISEEDYLYVAHAADQSHDINVKNCNLEKREQGEYCMDVIDTDRKCLAEENGYTVILRKLYPEDCTPKNRLLIGSYFE